MTTPQVISYRQFQQQLTQRQFKEPAGLVKWLTAVQAQDYAAGKWAIGLRLLGSSNAAIEQSIEDRLIIRTWALRGTLHFIAPIDIRWLLKLLSPRLISIHGNYYRRLGLDKSILSKTFRTMTALLRDGKQLTRKEIKVSLAGRGIPTHEMRVNFLLLRAALEGLICLGARRGKQFTYTLLDEWSPVTRNMDREEALAELARRYFSSHGPATISDFAWWSGLTLADVKAALKITGSNLRQETIKGQTYWMDKNGPDIRNKATVHLLPAFDEYWVGYADRTIAVDKENRHGIAKGSVLNPTVIVNGGLAGFWRRGFVKNGITIETRLFSPINETQKRALSESAARYGKFFGSEVEVKLKK